MSVVGLVQKVFLGHGDFSDVYLERNRTLSLRWEDGQIDSIVRSEESGLGLRVIEKGETRYGHMDLLHPFGGAFVRDERDKFDRLIRHTTSGLSRRPIPPLAPPAKKSHPVKIQPSDVSLEEKMKLLQRAYAAASIGPHIRQVTINFGEKWKEIGTCNSKGEASFEERPYLVFSVTVTVERGREMQTAYEAMGGIVGMELFEGQVLERLGVMASRRAHRKLDAPQAPVGEMPVVIASSAGGTLIHEAIGHSLEADAVLEGTSPSYGGKIGKIVASEKLTVLDDPTVANARGSFYYDDEGTPSERSVLIDKGVLKDYMYDRRTSMREGRRSNGHGRRESYAHRPIPRMSNTFVAPGSDNPTAIVKSFQNGLLVTKMGGGQVNTANGDFVFEVEEGYHVTGHQRRLVRGASLLGNGPEVLRMVEKVGSDLGWSIGTCGKEGQGVPVSDGLPTIQVKKMVIGGQ